MSTVTSKWISCCLGALLVLSLAMRICYASVGLSNPMRFWDERYSTQNVDAVLSRHDLLPRNGIYLGLNHLPPAALIWAIDRLGGTFGLEQLSMYRENGWRTNERALLLCRVLQAIYGTASLWLVFLIGRKLFSPGTGLLAAILLCATPIHIRMSSQFKPDILVLLMTLIAFYWSIAALRRPSAGRYASVGAAIGLATAAKYTGIPSAIPLASATLWKHWTDLGRWRRLVLAAAVSVACFFLLNPHVGILLRDMSRISATNARRAAAAGTTRLDVPLSALRQPLSVDQLGPWVGSVSLLGLLFFAVILIARHRGRRRRLGAKLLLTYVIGFIVFYTVISPDPKENLLFTLLPFFCLAAAEILVSAWETVSRRLRDYARLGLGALFWTAAVAWVLIPAVGYATAPRVPTTQEKAMAAVIAEVSTLSATPDPRAPHLIYLETSESRFPDALSYPHLTVVATGELGSIDHRSLDFADAEIFPESALAGPQASFYSRRLESGIRAIRVSGRWPWARGPDQVVVIHPWIRDRKNSTALSETPATGSSRILFPVPPSHCAHLISLEILLPAERNSTPPEVTVAGEPIRLFVVPAGEAGNQHYLTPRFASRRLGPVEIVSAELAGRDKPLKLLVHHWRPVVVDADEAAE